MQRMHFDTLFPFPRIPTRDWIAPIVARFSHRNLPKQDNPLNVWQGIYTVWPGTYLPGSSRFCQVESKHIHHVLLQSNTFPFSRT